MVIYFGIYLLGSVISLILSLISLKSNDKKEQTVIDHANDKLSKRFDCYERVDFIGANTYCAINFFMSWLQVAMFIFAQFPSLFVLKIHFYRIVSAIFIWICTKSNAIAISVVNRHNDLIREFNKKHGIKEE